MKAVCALMSLCLLAGFVTAEQYAWQLRKVYSYTTHGRLLAGISEINTQYAGLEMFYKVDLAVIGPDRVNIKPHDFRVYEVNEEQDGGWRDIPTLKGAMLVVLPPEIIQYLESPIEVKFDKGVVDSIKVQGNLPTWAINIKKGQVSHFVLNSVGHNAVITGNLNRPIPPNQVRPEDPTTQSGMFYETMEETVLGKCETYYTVTESGPYASSRTDPIKSDLANNDLPSDEQKSGEKSEEVRRSDKSDSSSEESDEKFKYVKYMAYKEMVKGRSDTSSEDVGVLAPAVFHQFCENQYRLMEFTKTINYTKCEIKPVLGQASPSFILNSRAGDNAFGSALARVTYSRYIACGKDRKQFTILKVEQEEQIYSGILHKEKKIGGTVKNVTLYQILPLSRVPEPPKEPKEITDLTYTFDPREQKLRKDGKLKTAFDIDVAFEDTSYESNELKTTKERKDKSKNPRIRRAAYEYESEESYEEKEYSLRWPRLGGGEKEHLKMPSLTQAPLNPMLVSPLNTQGMKGRVAILLLEIVNDITDEKPVAEEETVSKTATVAKILRFLDYVDVEQLYNEFADKQQTEDQRIVRKIFIQAVAQAGTNPNIKLLIDLIVKQKITGEEAIQLVMTFAMYIRTPTIELIKYFFEKLVDFSPSPEDMDQLHTTASLAFANLLFDACVNKRIANTRYPVQIYGDFCDANLVEREYLKYLEKQLDWALEQIKLNDHSVGATHWATVFLASLGNTGHPAIARKIQYVLDTQSYVFIKTKAVLALKRVLVSRSEDNAQIGESTGMDRRTHDVLTDEVIEKNILPILTAVVFDKTEDQEVRMAATDLFVKCTYADITLWQQLAYSTWFEPNQEVHSYIYHLLNSLSQLKRPIHPVTWVAQRKALSVIPMVKPIELGLPRSRTHLESDYFDKIQSGYMHRYSQFGSPNSVIPNAIYYQNYKQYAGAIGEHPLEVSVHGHTIHDVLVHLVGKFQRPSDSAVEGNDVIQNIVEILNIVDREQDESPQAEFHIKLRNEMERIISFNREVIDKWVEIAKKSFIPAIINGIPINEQKAYQLGEATFEFPTTFGIPVTTVLRHNNLISLRGLIKATGNFRHLEINLELHPIISYKTESHITFKSPFTGKGYQTGVQHHAVFEFPFRSMLRKTSAGDLTFAITPTHLKEGSVDGSIDIWTFHRRPYTIIVTDELWPISHKEGGQMKIVHATDTPYEKTYEFGVKSLGLAFKVEQKTEYQPEEEKYPGWSRFFRRFSGSVGGWFHKGLMGSPTLRLAERTLTLDVSQSKTKTVLVMAAGKFRKISPHVVSEASDESKNQDDEKSGESSGSSSEEATTPKQYQFYSMNSGDYSTPMDKKIKQRPVHEYYKSQYEGYEQMSEEYYEEYEGQFKISKNTVSYEAGSYEKSDPEFHHRRWFVIAVLGKTNPLHPPLKVREMQPNYVNTPSVVQYLVSGDMYPGHTFLRASAGEPTKEHAKQLPQNSKAVDNIKQAIINSPLTNTQAPFCGDYVGDYQFPHWANRQSLLTLRANLLRQELKVSVRGEVSFGSSCRTKIHNITFNGELARDQEMQEYAKTESFEAKKCNEDEKKGFFSSPVCITNSEQQAAALNTAKVDIYYSQLPIKVYNATVQVRELVKAYWYEYMSYNPFVILNPRGSEPVVPESHVKVIATLTPDIDYLTLKFLTPKEWIFFENIKLSRFAKAVFPITATQTQRENIRDRVFKTAASCSVEQTFVNTIDNVTYTFDPDVAQNCEHVLLQDCSGEKAISVLGSNLATLNVKTTVLLPGNFRIELIPSLRPTDTTRDRTYVSANTNKKIVVGQGRVIVNGVPVTQLPTVVHDKEGQFIARIEEGAGASLQLFAHDIKVTTDGRHIVLYPSNMLRNSTCGMCGNFDVSKTVDFRSPRDCPLSSGTLLSAAYALQRPWDKEAKNGICKISEDAKKAIEEEERDCESDEFIPVYASGDCKEKIIQEVGDAVYNIVKKALKYVPGVNSGKWATKARDKVRELLAGGFNPSNIAELIATAIASFIPVAGKIVKPLIKIAVQKVVEVICSKSRCCDDYYY